MKIANKAVNEVKLREFPKKILQSWVEKMKFQQRSALQ